MLDQSTFEIKHIRAVQTSSGRDPILIERVLYAFGLLEALVRVGTPFIFKGGTCLMLLLEHPMRLSTDIDIIVEPGTNIDAYIEEAAKLFPFEQCEEQERGEKNNIVKRHFKFYYRSPLKDASFHILLDVLFENNNYSTVISKEINNELLITKEPKTYVTVPNANCILGDKLTAFAPHTIGVPLGRDKEMEIIKQMYDVYTLCNEVDDFEEVKETYKKVAQTEIEYRGLDISYEDALKDTIRAASCIISKGYTDKDDFLLYIYGINCIRSHIFNEKYSGEIAAFQACKVLCLAVYILTEQNEMITISHPEEYIDVKLPSKEYAKMSYVRKLKLEAYAYLVEGVKILK
jgi:hypothetical protein